MLLNKENIRHIPLYAEHEKHVPVRTDLQKGIEGTSQVNELVNQAKKGDPDAFTELMQSQMQNMYKAARAILIPG